jgi:alkaline phosphatase
MKRITILLFSILLLAGFYSCQTSSEKSTEDNKSQVTKNAEVKNIILLIGDGMGVTQISAGMTVSKEPLAFSKFKNIGFQTTHSASDYITDSGASGTALATGKKTKKGMIGVDSSENKLTSILEIAEKNGLSTGLISTSSILHATPAAFIAHNPDRHDFPNIAEDFLKTDIDVFIGGGYKNFSDRDDGKNLIDSLKAKNYKILRDIEKIKNTKSGKLAGFTAEKHNPKYSEGRGEMLPVATKTALNILDNNKKGFFLMVEGSQIDWGGHDNDANYIIEELLDFNNAVEKALEFAEKNENTLVIVTADHECGGMAITGGSIKDHRIEAKFPTDYHTPVMVPVFAKGPGAEQFQGIYDNTDIFKKMKKLYRFK